MPKHNTIINQLLALLYKATAMANIADNAASSPLTSWYIAFHSADPGVGNDQTSNEISYTGYARVATPRSAVGWTAGTLQQAINAAQIQFGLCTAGSATATHVSIGESPSGAGRILVSGALDSALAISANIRPQFDAGALVHTET